MHRTIIGIFVCMLLVGTVLPVSGTVIIDNTTSSNLSGNTLYVVDGEAESKITIDTNKLHYGIGETVEITYTNVDNAVAGFVIGTARPVIPRIIEVKAEKVLYLTNPSLCYPCVMMYGALEPGDSLILEWDQWYYGYEGDYDDQFTPSEQVPEGEYYVELGYWMVTGEYNPPYMVPGGPPDYYVKSKIFSISETKPRLIFPDNTWLDYFIIILHHARCLLQ